MLEKTFFFNWNHVTGLREEFNNVVFAKILGSERGVRGDCFPKYEIFPAPYFCAFGLDKRFTE